MQNIPARRVSAIKALVDLAQAQVGATDLEMLQAFSDLTRRFATAQIKAKEAECLG